MIKKLNIETDKDRNLKMNHFYEVKSIDEFDINTY